MKLLNLAVFAVLFCFNYVSFSVNGQDPPFPPVSQVVNFHTKAEYRDNVKKVSTYISEYYSYNTLQGRINVQQDGVLKTYIYENSTNQMMLVTPTQCQVTKVIEGAKKFFTPLWIDVPEQGSTDKFTMIGSTALLRKALRGIAINDGRVTSQYMGKKTVRGIMCDRYDVTGATFKTEQDNRVAFYFAVKEWKKFESLYDLNRRVPVRIAIYKASDPPTALPYIDLDFFIWEPYWKIGSEFMPPLGVGCPNKKSTKKLPAISNSYNVVIEKFDLFKQRQNDHNANGGNKYQYIYRKNIYYDGFLRLIKVEGYGADVEQLGLRARVILDFNRGISYVIDNYESCKVRHISPNSPFAIENNAVGFMKNARDIMLWGNNTYYLGKTFVRNVYTSVWERVLYKAQIPNDLDQAGVVFEKVVITNYILDSDSLEVGDNFVNIDIPVQTIVTGYLKDGQAPTYQMEHSYFSFYTDLYDDDDVIGVFNVANCYPDPDMKKYVEVYIPIPKGRKAIAQKYFKRVRHQLAITLAISANISPLRIPFIEMDFGDTTIKANVLMLEREPFSLSFKKVSQNSKPTDKMTPVNSGSLDGCAQNALDLRGKGLIWCGNQKVKCYVTNETKSFSGTPIPGNFVCDLYIRDDLNASSKEVASSYNLTQAKSALDAAILKNQANFTVYLDDTDGAGSITFSINTAIWSSKAVNDLSGNSLYSLAYSQYSLNPSMETTIVKKSTDDYPLTTIGDCYKSCKTEGSMECVSFSFCKNADSTVQCSISSKLVTRMNATDKNKYLTVNTICNTYVMSYLSEFTKKPGVIMLPSDKDALHTDDANMCAKQCALSDKIRCRSFEFCRTGECYLRTSQYLDLSQQKKSSTNTVGCSFYTIKYMADFQDSGWILVKDPNAIKVTSTDGEGCAKACAEQIESCHSFNYCPGITGSWDSFCELSSLTLNSPKVQTYKNTTRLCRHYEIIRARFANSSNKQTGGLTGGQFGGLLFGLFLLGLALGGASYYGYSYYKNRSASGGGGGFNLSVRFMRNQDHAKLEEER